MFSPGHYVTQLLAWTFANFAWQGLFVLVSLRICDFLLRESRSSVRYRVFSFHLAALAIAPLLALFVAHRAIAYSDPLGAALRASSSSAPRLFWPAPGFVSSFHFLAKTFPDIAAVWAAGVLIGIIFFLCGHLRHRRAKAFRLASPELTRMADDLSRKLGARDFPKILEAEVVSPYVVGVRDRRVILPLGIERQLPPEELRAILAHELAHVQRSDYSYNLLQSAVVLLLCLHPAAWILWARIRREREACCDEAAIEVCGSPSRLARALCRLTVGARAFDMGLPAAAGALNFRLQRLLLANSRPTRLRSLAVPVIAMAALAMTTIYAARTLHADAGARIALLASPFGPTISVHAHDPAGTFNVKLRQGRVLAVSIADQSIPSGQIIQQGSSVRVVNPSGRELLALQVNPLGGIAWQPRAKRPPSAF